MRMAADAGEKYADPVFNNATTSPPALRTRASICSRQFAGISFSTGTPPTKQVLRTGTMSSPWPPNTIAATLFTETLSSLAINDR